MYLVDTNVLSEARRGTQIARTWLRSVDADMIYLSVITLGEVMKGVALKRRSDPRAALSLQQWLEQLRHDYAERILPITDRIAIEWGRMAAERTRGMADGLIAATASLHRKTIVTRNADDFADLGIPLINPWQG
jgi:hypothetical protein